MFVVFKDEFHVKMMLADGLISTREVLWLFCTFCCLLFVKYVPVFRWMALAPAIHAGGSGEGGVCISFTGCF